MVRIWLILLLFCVAVFAKPDQKVQDINESVYRYFDISSTFMRAKNGEIYKIFIAAPKGAQSYKSVLIMTDGNAQFPMILNLYNPARHPSPPLIIAVGYDTSLAYALDRRINDLTPSKDEEGKGGSSQNFYEFIKYTLMMFVRAKFDVKEAVFAFHGHSLGGLFGIQMLLKNQEIFDEFFIASPSLWWDDSHLIKEAIKNGKIRAKFRAKFIRLSVGDSEHRRGKTDRAGVLNLSDFSRILRANGMAHEFEIYKGGTHGGVIPFGLLYALDRLSK